MIKSLLVVTLLCGPALADSKTLQLGLSIGTGKDARHYAIKVINHECGSIDNTAPERQDTIEVCANDDGTSFRLRVDWKSREGEHEIRNRSAVVVARGDTFDLDGGGAKLNVTVQ
jgi:hypothetical protein